MSQLHEPPDEAEITLLQQKAKKEKEERLLKRSDKWRNSLPERRKRAVSLAREKGAWNWLTVIPNKDTDDDQNKREFKDAIHLRYLYNQGQVEVVCSSRTVQTITQRETVKHFFIIQVTTHRFA